MTYYKRISDNNMNSEFVDGSLLLHTDMNEIETLTKAGINANYEDIQKLQDGTLTVQSAVNATNALSATTASTLSGASLSKSTDETLQSSDVKVPTAKQVKDYVDGEVVKDYDDLTDKPSINGVTLTGNKTSSDLNIKETPFYYWDGTNTTANVAMFNEICNRYTNNLPFVLMGKVQVQNGYYDENGEFVDRTISVVTEISVKNFEPYEDPSMDRTFLSFMTQPIRTTLGYAIGSIHLVGTTWGEYTEIQPMSWSYDECPIAGKNTINIVYDMPKATSDNVGVFYRYEGETRNGLEKGRVYTCKNISFTSTPNYQIVDVDKENYLGEGFLNDYYASLGPISYLGMDETLYLDGLQPGTYLIGLTNDSIDFINSGSSHRGESLAVIWTESSSGNERDNLIYFFDSGYHHNSARLLSNYAEFTYYHHPDEENLEDGTILAELKTLLISDEKVLVHIGYLERQASSLHKVHEAWKNISYLLSESSTRSFYIKKDTDGTLVPCGEHLTETITYDLPVADGSNIQMSIRTTIPYTKKLLNVTPRATAGTGANACMAIGVSSNGNAPLEILDCYPYIWVNNGVPTYWYFKMIVVNHSGASLSDIACDCIYKIEEDF